LHLADDSRRRARDALASAASGRYRRRTTMSRSHRHVALLRGINVGGKNKLAMSALVDIFRDEGAGDVSTFIQSGNVIFAAPPKLASALGARVERRLDEAFALRVPVVLRSADELAAVAARNPFLAAGADPATLHVMFLAATPTAAQARALDPARSPGDEFALVGRDLYLRLPSGVARTKLTNAYFDKALATVSTGRNWRTVLQLVELVTAVVSFQTPPGGKLAKSRR
jgi:uncharacterized protein (DUF1697 family)